MSDCGSDDSHSSAHVWDGGECLHCHRVKLCELCDEQIRETRCDQCDGGAICHECYLRCDACDQKVCTRCQDDHMSHCEQRIRWLSSEYDETVCETCHVRCEGSLYGCPNGHYMCYTCIEARSGGEIRYGDHGERWVTPDGEVCRKFVCGACDHGQPHGSVRF